MIDFNHRTKPGVPTTEQLDAASATMTGERRSYLGGSRLGEECARKLQYEYQGATGKPFPAKTQIVFAIGHASEDAVATLLRASGFTIKTHDENGFQFGFRTAGGRIKGHVDGVIIDGPKEFGPYPYLWEAKAVGNKYFNALVKHGVAKERPVYAGQVATYQAYMDLTENPALFSIVNRDTGAIEFERVPFDAKLAQECTDRGVQVLQAVESGEMIPRPYPDADFFKCKFCDYAEECWRS